MTVGQGVTRDHSSIISVKKNTQMYNVQDEYIELQINVSLRNLY